MKLIACCIHFRHYRKGIAKSLLIMKMISIFIVAFCLTAGAKSYSQKISLSLRNVPIEKVFKEISVQTGFSFFYTESLIKKAKKVTITIKEVPLEKALNECFKDQALTFSIVNKLIVIKEKLVIPEIQQMPITILPIEIGGKVTNENGGLLIGATVTEKGTENSTATKEDGSFSIYVSGEKSILVISHVGYQQEEFTVRNQKVFSVVMKTASTSLNDIIVVGYGTQKKINLTGAVGNIQMGDLESRPITNSSQALQGKISGVFALQKSGKPGGDDAIVNIRGVGTLNNSEALILIDGIPGNMNDVNANDIKSISVLKDAASASIYGNRAANGVILITTKRGEPGKMNITYDDYAGIQKATALPKMASSAQWATLYNEALANSGSALKYTTDDIAKFAAHTDPLYPDINYFDVYYGKAKIQNHRLNVSGGNENLQYAFMVGHLNQNGILVGTDYKKTDFRSNIDAFLLKNKKLRFSTRMAGNIGETNEPTELFQSLRSGTIAPTWPLKNAANQWIAVIGERNYYGEIQDGSTTKIKRYLLNSQLEAEYKISNDLSAQVTYGYNIVSSNSNAFHANVLMANLDGSTRYLTSDLTVTNNLNTQTLLTSLLKYKKKIGLHEINLLAGYSEESFNWKWESGFRSKFINNEQRILNLGDASTMKNDAGNYDLGLQSIFGRINYNYASKYLFEANIRKDGSSRFANGHRWGTFPSFSAGWVLNKENFLRDVKWLNLLKIRGSWGRLGNQNINTYYAASDLLSAGQNYPLGGTLYTGVATTSMSNKQTTWETSEQTDFGIDIGINNAFDITVDYFSKKTSGILIQIPIPITMGDLTPPYQNVGAVINKGIELSATYKKTFSGGLKFNSTLSVFHIVNRIDDLYGRSPIINGSTVLKEGYAINSFYGYQMDGIYQISDFTWQNNSDPSIAHANRVYTLNPKVVAISNFTATPGDVKYKDLNGDGIVTMDKDRTVIGKQFPDLNYSLQMNVDWKQFDVGVFIQGVSGMQGYTNWNIATATNVADFWNDRWTPENPSTVLPKISLDAVRTGISSELYMGDASYLRLKNIELGYTLAKKFTSLIGINSIRVYGNIQNAFTITKFRGLDPEQVFGQVGVEAYPQVRIFTFGLNVNF